MKWTARGCKRLLDYTGPPPPPEMADDDVAWVDVVLRAAGLRSPVAGV